jgi:putative toxin-antitoxin system antitoxin component (TIGR02293 family)
MSTRPSPESETLRPLFDFTSPRVAQLLGWAERPRDALVFIELLQKQLSYRAFACFIEEANFPVVRTAEALGLAGSTLRKYARRPRAALPVLAQERIGRAAMMTAAAERVFADREKAHRWLWKSNRALGGKAPLEMLSTDAGTELVKETLGQIEFGMSA